MWVAIHHILPHLFSQFIVGLVLMFPHAVLHEAAVSFLGYGLAPEYPAIGIILSESTRQLSAIIQPQKKKEILTPGTARINLEAVTQTETGQV